MDLGLFLLEMPLVGLLLDNADLGDLGLTHFDECLVADVGLHAGLQLGVVLVTHLFTKVERGHELEQLLHVKVQLHPLETELAERAFRVGHFVAHHELDVDVSNLGGAQLQVQRHLVALLGHWDGLLLEAKDM